MGSEARQKEPTKQLLFNSAQVNKGQFYQKLMEIEEKFAKQLRTILWRSLWVQQRGAERTIQAKCADVMMTMATEIERELQGAMSRAYCSDHTASGNEHRAI